MKQLNLEGLYRNALQQNGFEKTETINLFRKGSIEYNFTEIYFFIDDNGSNKKFGFSAFKRINEISSYYDDYEVLHTNLKIPSRTIKLTNQSIRYLLPPNSILSMNNNISNGLDDNLVSTFKNDLENTIIPYTDKCEDYHYLNKLVNDPPEKHFKDGLSII